MTTNADDASDPLATALRWAGWTVVALAVAAGLALRLWYVFHNPVNSDEAIVGLMARDILHGHFVAFYWGQPYGGGEAYVVAPLFWMFGQSAYVLALTPVVLAAAASVLTWRAARRLVQSPVVAALAGAGAWVASDAVVTNSTAEYGFRGVTVVCGLAVLLCALRLLDGRTTWLTVGALGLFAGVGWWSSPEIAYFLLPAGLIVIGALWKSKDAATAWILRSGVALVCAALGALPWIWANVRSGGASLKSSSFPGGAATAMNTGYGGRLHVFFTRSLPIDLDLRHLVSGGSIVSGAPGVLLAVVVVAAVVLAALFCLVRRDRASAVGVGLLAFPLLYAAQPGTWYWLDGRYIVFFSPLLALVVASGIEGVAALARPLKMARARQLWPMALMSVAGAAAIALTAIAFGSDNQVTVSGYASSWSNPNGPVSQTVKMLEARGVHDGYADYWVAYKVDLLSRGAMTITPAPGDVDRSRAIDAKVRRSPHQAWLFVPSDQLSLGYRQFSATRVIVGPRAITEDLFDAALARLGIGQRTVHGGILDAVVPVRNVTVAQVLAAGA